MILLAALAAGAIAMPARAQTSASFRVLSRSAVPSFGEGIAFSLEIEGQQPLTEAILFYGQEDAGLVRRIYPSLPKDTSSRTGTPLTIAYTEQLYAGQYAPGTPMIYWWELYTEDDSTELPRQRFVYEDARFDWQTLPAEGLDLLWYGNQQRRARELAEAGEEALQRLQNEMGIRVEERVRVYVYNSASDMDKAIASRSQVYDSRVTTLGVAIGDDTLLLLGPHDDAEQTMAHELSHIVVGIVTENPYVALPRWLDEGLAMYAEGQLPRNNQEALDWAIREDDLLSLRSMSAYTGRPEEVDLFYGQVYSIVNFMLESYGQSAMHALLAEFSQGVAQEEALQTVYGFDLDTLEGEWRTYLGLEETEEGLESVMAPALPLATAAFAGSRF